MWAIASPRTLQLHKESNILYQIITTHMRFVKRTFEMLKYLHQIYQDSSTI